MEVNDNSADVSMSEELDPAQNDSDEAQPEAPSNGQRMDEARPEGAEEEADDDDDDDEDDDGVKVTIGEINSSPATGANFRNRFAKGAAGAKGAVDNGEVVEKQKTTIDIDAEGNIGGIPVKDFDVDSIADKPWRKPGADITDYFNYGFNEESWKAYCTKQQSLRVANGLPAIGHPNFAPEKESLLVEPLGKKPMVIDMDKIREKFNILGDRSKNIKKRDLPPMPQPTGHVTNSIAVIGGSDSTSRRQPLPNDGSIPTLSSKTDAAPINPLGIDLSQPPPGFPTGAAVPPMPPTVASAAAAAFPPVDSTYFAPNIPPFGAPPFDPFVTGAAPVGAFPPPIGLPPGSTAPSGWQAPPSGPPPLGYPVATVGQTAPRPLSPAVKEEEREDEERREHRRRGHSHHRDSSSRHRSPPEEPSSNRSRSPSRKEKHKDRERSEKRDKDKERKRGSGEEERDSGSRHKKSKKSDRDKEHRREDQVEIKREPE